MLCRFNKRPCLLRIEDGYPTGSICSHHCWLWLLVGPTRGHQHLALLGIISRVLICHKELEYVFGDTCSPDSFGTSVLEVGQILTWLPLRCKLCSSIKIDFCSSFCADDTLLSSHCYRNFFVC